jgi:MFS family permease
MAEERTVPGAAERARLMALTGLYASIFAFGISFGGLLPWMAGEMDGRGISGLWIGVVSAAQPVGILIMAPFTQRIVRRFGSGNAMIWCSVIALATVLPLGIWDSLGAWLVLRFVSGLAGSVPWVVTETWINAASSDRNRGRAVALYAAVMAAGFATGPETLKWAATLDTSPLPWFIGLQFLSLLIIIPLRRLAPALEDNDGAHVFGVIRNLPGLMSAAVISGALDASFFSFLAIWGERVGLSGDFALTLLSVFIAGNVLLQFPIGWLADRHGPYPIMLLCGAYCILSPAMFWGGLAANPVLLGTVAFIWGGCVWGAYAVALVAMGRRFTGGTLAVVNAAFVMAYTFANIVAPPVAGSAMDAMDPHGLMLVAIIVASSFTLIVTLRRREFDSN